MKIRNIGIIISREYLTRVRKKSFLITTFLVPVLFAAMCILPSVIMFMAKDTGKKVAVVDQSGIVMPYLVDTETIDYSDYSAVPVDSMKTEFKSLELDAIVVVSEIDPVTKSVSLVSYSDKPMSVDMKDAIQSKVDEAVEDYRLSLYDVSDLKQIMAEVESNISMATFTLDESGEEYRLLVLPDHPTPLRIRTHSSDPVPYVLYDGTKERKTMKRYTEAEAMASGIFEPQL